MKWSSFACVLLTCLWATVPAYAVDEDDTVVIFEMANPDLVGSIQLSYESPQLEEPVHEFQDGTEQIHWEDEQQEM